MINCEKIEHELFKINEIERFICVTSMLIEIKN